ncbi:MAG: hypothetical protein ACLSB9_24295 [Hydrogeniiclostridium mannosilyticum]
MSLFGAFGLPAPSSGLELKESGAPTDYLRTMNYKTEAVILTDRRGVRSSAFVSEPEQCLVQL